MLATISVALGDLLGLKTPPSYEFLKDMRSFMEFETFDDEVPLAESQALLGCFEQALKKKRMEIEFGEKKDELLTRPTVGPSDLDIEQVSAAPGVSSDPSNKRKADTILIANQKTLTNASQNKRRERVRPKSTWDEYERQHKATMNRLLKRLGSPQLTNASTSALSKKSKSETQSKPSADAETLSKFLELNSGKALVDKDNELVKQLEAEKDALAKEEAKIDALQAALNACEAQGAIGFKPDESTKTAIKDGIKQFSDYMEELDKFVTLNGENEEDD
jgi:hypothetical protein